MRGSNSTGQLSPVNLGSLWVCTSRSRPSDFRPPTLFRWHLLVSLSFSVYPFVLTSI